MKRPPNVLFLMSDEHRADIAGFAGNSVVRTPTLDWLASTGTVFSNAYAPSPICIPGRQAMMAGQLPRTCGCERFGQDLEPNYMTFAHRFAQYGYMTACCGKLHHVGRDQMQGWTKRFGLDMFVYENFIQGRNEEACARFAAPREKTWKLSQREEVTRARVDHDSRNQRFDEHATQYALEYIEDYFVDMTYDRPETSRPVMLKHSLLQPHYPYVCHPEAMRYYFNRVQPFVNETRSEHPFLGSIGVEVGKDVTAREVRRATAAYYGMIEHVDTLYQRTLDALVEVGQNLDDWLIIYTSDHGEMLGEHGVWEKQKFYEGSARVPLIVRLPKNMRDAWGCQGNTITQNVNQCDLFATLCELCEIPLPATEETGRGRGLDSRSLVPLFKGETRQWETAYHDETISQFAGTNLMIKRGSLKYQWYARPDCAACPEVLFDLAADPGEQRNVAQDKTYAQAMEAFRVRRDELGFAPADSEAGEKLNAAYVNAGY